MVHFPTCGKVWLSRRDLQDQKQLIRRGDSSIFTQCTKGKPQCPCQSRQGQDCVTTMLFRWSVKTRGSYC